MKEESDRSYWSWRNSWIHRSRILCAACLSFLKWEALFFFAPLLSCYSIISFKSIQIETWRKNFNLSFLKIELEWLILRLKYINESGFVHISMDFHNIFLSNFKKINYLLKDRHNIGTKHGTKLFILYTKTFQKERMKDSFLHRLPH